MHRLLSASGPTSRLSWVYQPSRKSQSMVQPQGAGTWAFPFRSLFVHLLVQGFGLLVRGLKGRDDHSLHTRIRNRSRVGAPHSQWGQKSGSGVMGLPAASPGMNSCTGVLLGSWGRGCGLPVASFGLDMLNFLPQATC